MTAHDDRDPLPREEWREASSAGIRRLALEACAEAVRRAKEARVGTSASSRANEAYAATQGDSAAAATDSNRKAAS